MLIVHWAVATVCDMQVATYHTYDTFLHVCLQQVLLLGVLTSDKSDYTIDLIDSECSRFCGLKCQNLTQTIYFIVTAKIPRLHGKIPSRLPKFSKILGKIPSSESTGRTDARYGDGRFSEGSKFSVEIDI